MKVQRTVRTDKPLTKVFDYLSDFTTTYRNTSEFMGRQTELRYVVQELVPGERIKLRGENKTVISIDTMTFRPAGDQTEVTYSAEFDFKGPVRYLAPLLRPALNRLGDQAETGLSRALANL